MGFRMLRNVAILRTLCRSSVLTGLTSRNPNSVMLIRLALLSFQSGRMWVLLVLQPLVVVARLFVVEILRVFGRIVGSAASFCRNQR